MPKTSFEIPIPIEVLGDIFHLLCDGPIALHDLKNESQALERGISVIYAFVDLFCPKSCQ